jgi:hypothetical protein
MYSRNQDPVLFYPPDPGSGSGMEQWSDPGSGINHPGSATLIVSTVDVWGGCPSHMFSAWALFPTITETSVVGIFSYQWEEMGGKFLTNWPLHVYFGVRCEGRAISLHCCRRQDTYLKSYGCGSGVLTLVNDIRPIRKNVLDVEIRVFIAEFWFYSGVVVAVHIKVPRSVFVFLKNCYSDH